MSLDNSAVTQMNYPLWALMLFLQNASFTFVSRARNSASYGLHAAAAMCSNGVWFATQMVSLVAIVDILQNGTTLERLKMAVFYTVCTVSGSVVMHWFGKTYIEKGKRKVGA